MLGHEYQHLVDMNSMGILSFLMMFLCPQILSIFSFFLIIPAIMFGIKTIAIIAAIIGIIFLLPWPSKSRVYLEMKSYLLSLYIVALTKPTYLDSFSNYIVDSLRSWLYYKMIWTKKQAKKRILAAILVLAKEDIANTSVAFEDIHEIITETD